MGLESVTQTNKEWIRRGLARIVLALGGGTRYCQLGLDDEAFGCGAEIVEGIAGYQRKDGPISRLQHRDILRLHYQRSDHRIGKLPLGGLNRDLIASSDVLQRPEVCVAMACNDAIAPLARPRGTPQVAGTASQLLGASARHDVPIHLQSRDRQAGYRRSLIGNTPLFGDFRLGLDREFLPGFGDFRLAALK